MNRRIYSVLCLLEQLTHTNNGAEEWADRVVALLHELDGNARWQNSMGLAKEWKAQTFWRA